MTSGAIKPERACPAQPTPCTLRNDEGRARDPTNPDRAHGPGRDRAVDSEDHLHSILTEGRTIHAQGGWQDCSAVVCVWRTGIVEGGSCRSQTCKGCGRWGRSLTVYRQPRPHRRVEGAAGHDRIGRTVCFALHLMIRCDHRNRRVRVAAAGLLNHVCQFVSQESTAGNRFRFLGQYHVVANGVCNGIYRSRGPSCLCVGMNSYATEIVSEARCH